MISNSSNLVFDCHAHVFPDAVAPRVMAELAPGFGLPVAYDGTRAGLLERMRIGHITGALNSPVATSARQVPTINAWAVAHNTWPVLSLGAVHPDTPDIAATLRGVRDSGLLGVKLHPEDQSFLPDEPRLEPIWRLCRDLDLVVLIHAGGDRLFKPPFRGSPERIAKVVRAWPGLKLIAAHLGGYQMWDEFERDLAGLPVFLDISFVLGFLPDEEFVRIVRRHGTHQIVFGSDAPWQDPVATLEHFRRLPFTKDEQRAILWDNAAGLLKLKAPACEENGTCM